MPNQTIFNRSKIFVGIFFIVHTPMPLLGHEYLPQEYPHIIFEIASSSTLSLHIKDSLWPEIDENGTCNFDISPQLLIALMLKGLLPTKKEEKSSHNHHEHDHEPEPENNENKEKEIEEEKDEDKKKLKKKAKKYRKTKKCLKP